MTNSDIRRKAKQITRNLKGRFFLFLTPTLLSSFLVLVNLHRILILPLLQQWELETQILPLLLNFLIATFSASTSLMILAVVRKQCQSVSFSDSTLIFEPFLLWPTIKLSLLKQLLLLPLLFLLEINIVYIAQSLAKGQLSLELLGGVVSLLLVTTIYIKKKVSYTMALFLLFDQLAITKRPNSLDILKASQWLMKGYIWQYIKLELSFLGWQVLGFLSLGYLNSYLFPYQQTAKAFFYQQRLQLLKNNETKNNHSNNI